MNYNKTEQCVLGVIILTCLSIGTLIGMVFDQLANGIMGGSIISLVIGVIYEVLSLAKENTE